MRERGPPNLRRRTARSVFQSLADPCYRMSQHQVGHRTFAASRRPVTAVTRITAKEDRDGEQQETAITSACEHRAARRAILQHNTRGISPGSNSETAEYNDHSHSADAVQRGNPCASYIDSLVAHFVSRRIHVHATGVRVRPRYPTM